MMYMRLYYILCFLIRDIYISIIYCLRKFEYMLDTIALKCIIHT